MVIGAGCGRTGTHSLKIALEHLLGGPCHHMVEVFAHPEQVPTWHAAAEGHMPDWREFLAGYKAVVDFPGSMFWEELSQAFPEAQVILSTRSSESWWKSASATIFDPANLDRAESPEWKAMIQALLGARFTTDIFNKEAAIAAFEQHNARVIERCPKNRLVIWQATDGWEPICEALGLPIPEIPFPNTNSTAEFVGRR